jgi:hypothetical protein
VLWTHNDSGDSATIYAINLAGELLGTFRLPGARARDWEDISLGPCPRDRDACLYLADTGDNDEKRAAVSIYLIPEPDPTAAGAGDTLRTAPARELVVRYPDGPHDVEAAAVDPAGNLMLITKGRTYPIQVFRVPHGAFDGDSAVAVAVDTLPIIPQPTLGRWVTGAAVSPSGNRMVVRTYTELYFFRLAGGKLTLDGAPCWLGGAEPQGEAVDFLDEQTVVLTSETVANQLGPLHRATCPTSRRSSP